MQYVAANVYSGSDWDEILHIGQKLVFIPITHQSINTQHKGHMTVVVTPQHLFVVFKCDDPDGPPPPTCVVYAPDIDAVVG